MLVGLINSEIRSCRNIIKIIIGCLLIVGFILYVYRVESSSQDAHMVTHSTVPLLLNSGEVQTNEAEVSIILWFENGNISSETWTYLPIPDWTWTYKELQTGSEKVAVTLSGNQSINKNEESNLYQWYTARAQELAKAGGKIYIDERVDQAMDISSYLSKTDARPAQWALMGNLLSIAAYQSNFATSVLAGQDSINIQLLSRGTNSGGRTVLAIPALLKEF